MHGLIHVIFRGFVVDKFGESAWKGNPEDSWHLDGISVVVGKTTAGHSVSHFFRGKVCSCQELFPTFPLGLQVLKQVRH